MSETTSPAPLVSVVTIFLNGEPFLGEAIESVMAQSCRDFELLLVDDGSTDDSTSLARAWAERNPGRIVYLEHEEHANRGMSASRNLGIEHARGIYLAFIDADDVWRPEKLAEQLSIMREHEGLGMVCGAVNYWSSWAGGEDTIVPTGHIQNRPVAPPDASLALYPLGQAAAPCPSDLLLRLDVVRALGGFEAHFTGPRQMYEDQGFLAKLYLAAPVYFSDRVWLDYRQHDASCVAAVTRDGRYREVRGYFLAWFRDYLRGIPGAPAAVVRAVDRALLCHRYPGPTRLLGIAASLARRIGWRLAILSRLN
jgi:glycosyltransferase involved in cell wall biosynthesis